MAPDLKAAEDLCNKTFFRAVSNLGTIASFRRVVAGTLPAAEPATYAWALRFLSDPSSKRLFLEPDRIGPLDLEAIARHATDRSLKNARAVTDAATIVFAHSVVDDAAYQYGSVSALAEPDDWANDISGRKVSFGQVKLKGVDFVSQDLLAAHLKQLEREPLMDKMEALFKRCRPTSDVINTSQFKYSPERLAELDSLRHKIVHGEGVSESIPTIDKDLDYLAQTTMMMFFMVSHRYGFKIDPYSPFSPWTP